MTKTRETYLDVAKFVAMLAIVFIHVRTYAPERADVWPVVGLENFVTTFVLPLFVLVSGYFSKTLFATGDRGKLVRRIVSCLWPVLTMNVLMSTLIGWLAYGTLAHPESGWIRHILSGGWFFFCLAICDCLTFFAHWAARGRSVALAGVMLVEFCVLAAVPVGLCHVRDMIPFFWFGLYAYPALRKTRYCSAVGFAGLLVFSIACGLLPDFRTIGLNVHVASVAGSSLVSRGFPMFVARILLGLAGALGVLELIRALVPSSRAFGFLSSFGSQTMGVFFIHIQLLVVYYRFVGWTGAGVAGRLCVAIVIFFVAHGLSVLTHRNPVVSAVLWNPLAWRKKSAGK